MAFAGLWERWTIPDGIKLPRSLVERAPHGCSGVEDWAALPRSSGLQGNRFTR